MVWRYPPSWAAAAPWALKNFLLKPFFSDFAKFQFRRERNQERKAERIENFPTQMIFIRIGGGKKYEMTNLTRKIPK